MILNTSDKLPHDMEEQPRMNSFAIGELSLRASQVQRILDEKGDELIFNTHNQLLHIIQEGIKDNNYQELISLISNSETIQEAISSSTSTLMRSMFEKNDLTNEQYTKIRNVILHSTDSDIQIAA